MKICLVCHKYSVPLDDPCCYPLGFMYVSAELKKLGHEVKVLNYNLFDYNLAEEVDGFDLVGFTGFEEFAERIIHDSKVCKELGVQTVLGGALATFIPEIIGDYVDKLCIGEFKERSKIDLSIWPDYEGFGIEEYHKRHKLKYMGVLTSRGCSFNCSFCAQTCKFSTRNLDDVFAEIDHYIKVYEIEMLVFYDNTFNLSKKRFLKICQRMQKRGITWSASIRCDLFDEEMAKAAKESGCVYFVVGVESFTQKRLDKMNKGIKVEQIYQTLDLLHKYGIKYHGNVLLGFEDEHYVDIALEANKIPKKYNVFPTLVQPFLGTKNGVTRLLSDQEVDYLNTVFLDYVETKGMYQYPALPKVGTA